MRSMCFPAMIPSALLQSVIASSRIHFATAHPRRVPMGVRRPKGLVVPGGKEMPDNQRIANDAGGFEEAFARVCAATWGGKRRRGLGNG